MIPNCATQDSKAPRFFRTEMGMMGSDAKLSSMVMNTTKTKKERMIGVHRMLGKERPKRNSTIVKVRVAAPR